jgi:hypothetical protein
MDIEIEGGRLQKRLIVDKRKLAVDREYLGLKFDA